MPSWGYRKVIEQKNEVRTREAVRTLYVAMTRAKDRLVVLGTWPQSAGSKKKTKKSGVEVVSGAKSYTELLLARDAPMPRLTELAETAGGEWRDEDGTKRWLFPYIWLKNEAPPEQEARLEADRVRAGGGGRPFSPGSPADLIASHREARSRMERPISMSASSAASHEVVEAVEHRNREGSAQMSLFDRDGRPARQEPDVEQVERPVAKAVGTAIHHALETWDPGSPIEEELEKAIEIASRRALFELDDRHSQLAAQKRIEAVLEAFGSGPLARRFSEIGPYIYGREVDVLLPPNEAFGPEGEKGPLGYVVGTIDLVYRDPSKGRWVVADYKTDVGDDRERVESLRAFYAPQMRVYAEALRLGLKLEEMPRMELWLLNARTIEEI
jgi:ATP-dependent exoDNAse (exonuclease V) beta subunit